MVEVTPADADVPAPPVQTPVEPTIEAVVAETVVTPELQAPEEIPPLVAEVPTVVEVAAPAEVDVVQPVDDEVSTDASAGDSAGDAAVLHTAVVEAVTGDASIGEPVFVARVTEAQQAAGVGESSESTQPTTGQPIAVELAEQVADEDIDAQERRMWLSRAALPVLWFAITGVALMLGGAIIGVLVGIVLGIGATVLYRRERERDLVRRNNTGAQVASEDNKADSFDSIGVH